MKKLLILLFILLFMSCCLYTKIEFNDVNDYKKCIVLTTQKYEVGGKYFYVLMVKDTLQNYHQIILKNNVGEVFNVGDTI